MIFFKKCKAKFDFPSLSLRVCARACKIFMKLHFYRASHPNSSFLSFLFFRSVTLLLLFDKRKFLSLTGMTAKGGNYQEKPLKGNYWIFQGNCKQGNFSF